MAPELKVDILPEWVVAEYRAHFPNWSPRDVFWGATTAGRSWRGQVIEAEARARAGTPTWVYQVDYASRVDPVRGAFHTMDIPLVFGTFDARGSQRSEEHTYEIQSLMRISYAVFCLKK